MFSKVFIENLQKIPDIKMDLRKYIFEKYIVQHNDNELWLEFGVYNGRTINYISNFTNNIVYGFDSFEGLPETWRPFFPKGSISANGILPKVNNNVKLIKGLFDEVLIDFLKNHQEKKISFIHIDSDLYSSAKYVLNTCKNYIKPGCIIIFDELVNYPGFDGNNGELRAWYEFITENEIDYEWLGMCGYVGCQKSSGLPGNDGLNHENVALKINYIK